MAKQIQNFERYLAGESVNHFYEIFLIIFADLKKHLFTYQFLSTALSVKNYTVSEWCKFDEVFGEHEKQQLSNFIKSSAN